MADLYYGGDDSTYWEDYFDDYEIFEADNEDDYDEDWWDDEEDPDAV